MPPIWDPILSFSLKVPVSEVHTLPKWVHTPPMGNPGSAPAVHCCTQHCWLYGSVCQSRGVMEPLILVTEANIWCVKITVNAKWVMTRILTVTQSR